MNFGQAFLNLVNNAKKHIKEINIQDLLQIKNKSEKFYLIDVREESEVANGMIPGAEHISKGMLELRIEKAIPDKTAKIVLYCGGGYRSALAAYSLKQMGYDDVTSLDGGYHAWKTL